MLRNIRTSCLGVCRGFSTTSVRGQVVPYVVDSQGHFDLYSRLLKERIVFVSGTIDDNLANSVVGQLLFLESESVRPISMYINSPGGSVTSGLAIYDVMQYVTAPVHTICIGRASSMASLILAGGHKGERTALPHSSVMIHQPSGGADGQASDISIVANEILRIREEMFELYSVHCTRDGETASAARERFEKMLDRDHYLTPQAALEQGIIDRIIKRIV